jgi:hypothetical protein
LRKFLFFLDLFKFLAAQVDRLNGPYVGDIVERIFLQRQQVGELTLGQRAEFLIDAEAYEKPFENDWITCIGVKPDCTISSISRCSEKPWMKKRSAAPSLETPVIFFSPAGV